ncbi:hypothetical protein BS78_K251000 [Paspalum vaginatum]|uniref:Uncharacterized protein n=1 Tax=Paspalum vaginatum TaxID=158149 RepID=A0A9W8CF28_9POAL|nr:hypothetical protein BS78_K251000 [Paspalum vaginatum]
MLQRINDQCIDAATVGRCPLRSPVSASCWGLGAIGSALLVGAVYLYHRQLWQYSGNSVRGVPKIRHVHLRAAISIHRHQNRRNGDSSSKGSLQQLAATCSRDGPFSKHKRKLLLS